MNSPTPSQLTGSESPLRHEDGPLVLTVTRPESPDNRRRHIRVSRQRCLVGSSPQASVCIKESSLAERHAEIVRGPLGTYVRRLEEQIEVNGETAAEAWIDNGDQLGFGQLEMLVEELGFDASGWSIEWDTLFPSLNEVNASAVSEPLAPASASSAVELTEATAEVAPAEASGNAEGNAVALDLDSDVASLPAENTHEVDPGFDNENAEASADTYDDEPIAAVEVEELNDVDDTCLNESSTADAPEASEHRVLESPGTLDDPAAQPESVLPTTFEIPYCDLSDADSECEAAAPEATRAEDYRSEAEVATPPHAETHDDAVSEDGDFDPWMTGATSHAANLDSVAPSNFDVWQPESSIDYDDVVGDDLPYDVENHAGEPTVTAEPTAEIGGRENDLEPAAAAFHDGVESSYASDIEPASEIEPVSVVDAESDVEPEPASEGEGVVDDELDAEPQPAPESSAFGESSNWLKELYDSIIPDDRDEQFPEDAPSEPAGFESPFAIPHGPAEFPFETPPVECAESLDSTPDFDHPVAPVADSLAEPTADVSSSANSGPTITSLLRDLNDLYEVTPSDEAPSEAPSEQETSPQAASASHFSDDVAGEPEAVASVEPEVVETELATEPEYEAESLLESQTEAAEDSVISALASDDVLANEETHTSEDNDANSVAAILERMRQSGEISSHVELPSTDESEPEAADAASVDIPEFQIPEPAAPPVISQDDSESEVDDYMSQLLNRLRGGSDTPTGAKVAVDNTKPVAKAPEVKKPESDDLEPENPLSATEYLPKAVAPEKPTNLSALRQIANQSVQAAIQRSVKSKNQSNSMMYLAGSGLSFFVSAVLFIMSKAWFDIAFLCGCAAAVACGLCGFLFVSVNDAMEKIRHRKAAREQSKAEIAEEADAAENAPANETTAG